MYSRGCGEVRVKVFGFVDMDVGKSREKGLRV